MTTTEGRLMPTGSTVMPRPANVSGRGADITGRVRIYPVASTKPPVRVPGRVPSVLCHRKERQWLCTRPLSHRGRCAFVRWELGGLVRAVWGMRPDVSKARKVSADEIRARLEAGISV